VTTDANAPPIAPAPPSFADQVAAVDAIKVAAQIVAQGKRAALLTSTVEIVAMAQLLDALLRITDLTFEMLATADVAWAAKPGPERRAWVDQLRARIDGVAIQLEALGYGVDRPTIITTTEKKNGEEETQRG
jgi:hypothetical protein